MRTFLLTALVLAGTALAGKPGPTDPPPFPTTFTPEQVTPEPGMKRIPAMHRHLSLTTFLHNGVVAGDLEAARKAAQALSRPVPIDKLDPAWLPHLEAMRDSASRHAGPWTLEDAARTTVEIGRNCAGCHTFVEGGPEAVLPRPAPEGYARHHWALTGMWTALLAGRTGDFKNAARALQQADLGAVPKADAQRFRELATRGTHASSRALMADTYAELLQTCSDCHTKMRNVE